MNVIELIQAIGRRPGMFFPSGELEGLAQFVRGFMYCREVEGLVVAEDDVLHAFYPFLMRTYGLDDRATWSELTAQLAARRSADPVQTFFEEFSRFMASREGEPV